nr:hypothetical protein [Micromonospora sp. DSM 115978]
MTRTTVYVDSADLATIKEAPRRLGVPEAEIIREGVHLAAMAHRQWAEPFFDEPLDLGGRVSPDEIRHTVARNVESGSGDQAAAGSF